jgi:hypothetical protein
VDPAVFTHKDHFEILAGSLERQRVSAVAGGKLELPEQVVPKPELGNEGKEWPIVGAAHCRSGAPAAMSKRS